MFVCEQSSDANGLTYFKFRILNPPLVGYVENLDKGNLRPCC